MPNPRSSVVLFSKQDREKFLVMMARLQYASVRLGRELRRSDASLEGAIAWYKESSQQAEAEMPKLAARNALRDARRGYNAAKTNYRKACSKSQAEAANYHGQMLVARQQVEDAKATAIGEVEVLLQQLAHHNDDQVCQGLYDAICHELSLAQRDRSMVQSGRLVYSYEIKASEASGYSECNLLDSARIYLKFKQLQPAFSALKTAATYSAVANEEIISCVEEVESLLNRLPKGKKVELNTYASLKTKIIAYFANYKSNDMMKDEVLHALAQAEKENGSLAPLNYLMKSLMCCVEGWVEASKPANRGSYRARFVSWMNRYRLPKEDPLFSFIVQLIEDTRCPLALEEYASSHTGYDTYAPISRPSKININILDESSARQLMEFYRGDTEAKSLKQINDELDAYTANEVRSERRVRFSDEGVSGDDAVIINSGVIGDKVRLLTAGGQRKLHDIKKKIAELKKSLENYARHAAGNRQVAMKVLSKLVLQPTDVLNETTRHQLENEWSIYSDGGLTTDDEKESQDILKTAFLLNETIKALRDAEPTGAFSRCNAIVNTALVELTALKFKSKDFVLLPILSLSRAIEQIEQIIDYDPRPAAPGSESNSLLNSLARDSRPAWLDDEKNILDYYQKQLSLLVESVKSEPPSRQREVLSQGLNRLANNWRRVDDISDRLKAVFDHLDRLNESVAWPTARGGNDHLTSAVGVRLDYLPSADGVDSSSAKKALRYAKQFDLQPGNSLKLMGGKAEKLPEENKYAEISDALQHHDSFSVQKNDDFYQRRYLTDAEYAELETLVGKQFVNLSADNVAISYEFNDQSFNLLTLQKSLLDACQTARLSGVKNDALDEFESKITGLFNANIQPNFSAQIHYIKKDVRFKYLSLKPLCGFETHPATNSGEGVSLLGLYHALKLEEFVKEKIVTDYMLCDFNSLPENIRTVLHKVQLKITEHLPVYRELKLLTYKGLVEALLAMFDKPEADGSANKLAKSYPELSHVVLSIVLGVEENSSLESRDKKLEDLSHYLMVIIEPYISKKEFFNPAVLGLLKLIDQADRRLTLWSQANQQQEFFSADKRKILAHLPDDPNSETPPTVAEIKEICDEKRLEEREILHNESLLSPQNVVCQLTQQQKKVKNKFVEYVEYDKTSSASARQPKPNAFLLASGGGRGRLTFDNEVTPADENTFSSQVINQSGLNLIALLTKDKVSALRTAVFQACRAYYVGSDDDYDVGDPLWRAHAYALERELAKALTRLNRDGPAGVVHAVSGYEHLDLDDLTPEQQEYFARTLLILKHVDAMIRQIEAESYFPHNSFYTDLKKAQKSIKKIIPQPFHFRRAHVPTWRGALTELHQLINEVEVCSKPNEMIGLRCDLLQGLNAIDSKPDSYPSDHDRMKGLAKFLKGLIKKNRAGSPSLLNKKMLDKLAALHEKMTREITIGAPKAQLPRGVDSLTNAEAGQLMRKFEAVYSVENSPTLVQDLVLSHKFKKVEEGELISRSAWLNELAQNAQVALPQSVAGQAGTFYARNGDTARVFLDSKNGVDPILANLALKSRAYSQTKNGFKRHRVFRFLATKVAQKVDAIKGDAETLDLASHAHYKGFLNETSPDQQSNLAKLLKAEAVVVKAMDEIDASGHYVANSEYRAILKASLKAIRSHLPKVEILEFSSYEKVHEAMSNVVQPWLSELTELDQDPFVSLADVIKNHPTKDTSLLCRAVAGKLVELVNDSYQPTCFGSRRNKYLNDSKILELFKIIERVECPLAQGNQSGDVDKYYDFRSDHLLMRLRSKLSSVIVKDAEEVKESLRVRSLERRVSVA